MDTNNTGKVGSTPTATFDTDANDRTDDNLGSKGQGSVTAEIEDVEPEIMPNPSAPFGSETKTLGEDSSVLNPTGSLLSIHDSTNNEIDVQMQTGLLTEAEHFGQETGRGITDLAAVDGASGLNLVTVQDIERTLTLLGKSRSKPGELLDLLSNQIGWHETRPSDYNKKLCHEYKHRFKNLSPSQKMSIRHRMGTREFAALKQELMHVGDNVKDRVFVAAEQRKISSFLSELQDVLYFNESIFDRRYAPEVAERLERFSGPVLSSRGRGGKILAEARKVVDQHGRKFEQNMVRHSADIDLSELPDELVTRSDRANIEEKVLQLHDELAADYLNTKEQIQLRANELNNQQKTGKVIPDGSLLQGGQEGGEIDVELNEEAKSELNTLFLAHAKEVRELREALELQATKNKVALEKVDYLPASFLGRDMMLSKLGEQPCSKWEGVSDKFVEELYKSKFVLVKSDGTTKFLTPEAYSEPNKDWSEAEKEEMEKNALNKLVEFAFAVDDDDDSDVADNIQRVQGDVGGVSGVKRSMSKHVIVDDKDGYQQGDIALFLARFSALANSDGMDFGDDVRNNMHKKSALPLPGGAVAHRISTQALGEDKNTNFPMHDENDNFIHPIESQPQSDKCYVITQTDEQAKKGGVTVTLHSETPLVGLRKTVFQMDKQARTESKKEWQQNINSNFSQWNTVISAEIDKDCKVKLNNYKYDYKAASYLNPSPVRADNAPHSDHQNSLDKWRVKFGVPWFSGMTDLRNSGAMEAAQKDYANLTDGGNNKSESKRLLTGLRENLAKLENHIDSKIHHRLAESAEYFEDILFLIANKHQSQDDVLKMSEGFTTMSDMIRAEQLQFERYLSADPVFLNVNDAGEDEKGNEIRVEYTNVLAHLTCLGATTTAKLQGIVATYKSAADDMSDSDMAFHINRFDASRVEFARMQSEAVNNTFDQILHRYQERMDAVALQGREGTPPDLQARSEPAESRKLYRPHLEKDVKLLVLEKLSQEMKSRQLWLSKQAADALAGHAAPGIFGAGIKGKEFKKLAQEMAKGKIQYDKTPISHSNLSELQLCQLELVKLESEYPNLKGEFADFLQLYRDNYNQMLKEQSWAPITNTYHDIVDVPIQQDNPTTGGAKGKLKTERVIQKLTSVITPAPSFKDSIFAGTYNNKGTPCSDRKQAKHVNNLNFTQQTNHKGEILYSGLRHGILDAYDLRPKALAQASQLVKDRLINDINTFVKEANADLELGEENKDQEVNEELFDTKEGIARLRAMAGKAMAREMVKAAVVTNPRMLDKIGRGEEVQVKLDSVSLVTPDLIRAFRSKGKSESDLLDNQSLAWDSLKNGGNPRKINFNVMVDGEKKFASVTAETNKYNISVNKYAVTEGFRTLLKPFMNWARSDEISKPSLEQLVGGINKREVREVGGEALKVMNFLLDKEEHGLTGGQAADIEAHLETLPFASREEYATAIKYEALEIKDIFLGRKHHRAGNDPYKLAERIPMLSHLLGRTPVINCKSGKDRTGMCDVMLQYHAANVAAGYHPRPDEPPDPIRITNYTFNTGNMTLQQYNTGLQGYKLLGVRALFRNLQNSLAQKLFLGDSKKVKE